MEYEELLQTGDPVCVIQWPEDDWETISLYYTSRPKGVLLYFTTGKSLESWHKEFLLALRRS